MQMIRIGQFDLAAKLLEVKCVHGALDSACGAHVHKDRGLYRAVRGLKLAAAGLALGF